MRPEEMSTPDGDSAGGAESIGGRLRRRRKALGRTLRDVANESGVAESFISQLERGVHTGSVKTLQRLGASLGLTLGELFDTAVEDAPQVARFGTHVGLEFGAGATKVRVTPGSFDHLQGYLGVLEPHGSTGSEPYSHGDSEELLVVLDGHVEVTVGAHTHRMSAFDSIPYSSSLPHRVVEAAGERAVVIWVTAPPSF